MPVVGVCIIRETRRIAIHLSIYALTVYHSVPNRTFTTNCATCRSASFLLLSLLMETIINSIPTVLPYVQIVLAILLVASILLQQRGSSLGGAFGGDNFSATFNKRRGAELFIFKATIVLAVLFVLSALITVVM